jgi:hypothetical protein
LEQEYRLGDTVPNYEQYWICRMGTSAVGPCMAVAEYVFVSFVCILSNAHDRKVFDKTETASVGDE